MSPHKRSIIAAVVTSFTLLGAACQSTNKITDTSQPEVSTTEADDTSQRQDETEATATTLTDEGNESIKSTSSSTEGGEGGETTASESGSNRPQNSQDIVSTSIPPIVDPAPAIESSGAKPNKSNVGPSKAPSRSMTSDQAIAELKAAKKLSGVKITGTLSLDGAEGKDWVIEDSVIESTGLYTLRLYIDSPFTGTKAQRPVFRNVEIVGGGPKGVRSSATVYGKSAVIINADIYGAEDGVKAQSDLEIHGSWIHDLHYMQGAHPDAIHIRSGTGIVIKGTRLDAYVGYSSDGSELGGPVSGGLQTGTTDGNIEALWEGNWFAGGGYTIRGKHATKDAHNVDYTFRDNIFMEHGTSVVLNRSNLEPYRCGPATGGGIGTAMDSSNVWEHTGLPVL